MPTLPADGREGRRRSRNVASERLSAGVDGPGPRSPAPVAGLISSRRPAPSKAGSADSGRPVIFRQIFLDPAHGGGPGETGKYAGSVASMTAPNALSTLNAGRRARKMAELPERPALRLLTQFDGPGRDLVFGTVDELDSWLTHSLQSESGMAIEGVGDVARPEPTAGTAGGRPFTERMFPAEILDVIFGRLTSSDLLVARRVSRGWNDEVTRQARGRIPYPDFAIFALLNQALFPSQFSKGKYNDRVVDKRENLQLAWQQYSLTLSGQQRLALVMRIFEGLAFREIRKRFFQELEHEQVLFRPATAVWTPQIDDSWILAHIHKRSSIMIMCDPGDQSNFWDERKGRITATGREILIARRSGYRLFHHKRTPAEAIAGGLLLLPPERSPLDVGILPANTGEIELRQLKFLAKIPKEALDPLTVEGIDFLSKVRSSLQENLESEIKGAQNTFRKLVQPFRQNPVSPQVARARLNCLAALSPDSHRIPYADQAKYRAAVKEWVLKSLDRSGLTTKNNHAETAERNSAFNLLVQGIFDEAAERAAKAD